MTGLVLGLIPARGGSKGLPRKNLRSLGGRPLVAHAIQHARASRSISRVVVSTDDPEIAEVARGEGAEVPFLRPAELARDETPDLPVFQHALRWLEEHERYRPELVVHLRPTSPLRQPETIDHAVELMRSHPEADSLKSVSLASQTPFKMWTVGEGYLQPLLTLPGAAEPYNLPRQALPRVVWQNGYVDVLRPRVLLEQGLMHGRRILAFEVGDDHIDIDDEESLERAERALSRRAPAPPLAAPRFSS
ncbi:MAG TPA: acylneuraminate cytidylyltransferase family protein [Vicinamibacteria bacterium]|jgi:N-acylneuraminate cytidylyltransferase